MENIDVNDHVILRKPHPCGGHEWVVVRIGADIGLECLTCGHKVFYPAGILPAASKETPSGQLLKIFQTVKI